MVEVARNFGVPAVVWEAGWWWRVEEMVSIALAVK